MSRRIKRARSTEYTISSWRHILRPRIDCAAKRNSANGIHLAKIEYDRYRARHPVKRRRCGFGSTAPDLQSSLGKRLAMQSRGIRRHLQSPLTRCPFYYRQLRALLEFRV